MTIAQSSIDLLKSTLETVKLLQPTPERLRRRARLKEAHARRVAKRAQKARTQRRANRMFSRAADLLLKAHQLRVDADKLAKEGKT